MGRKKIVYGADFETTTTTPTRVWSYGIADVYNLDNYRIGTNIDDFMSVILSKPCDVYFHNLKFDGSFIVDYLLKNGYIHTDESTEKTFNTVITDSGQWFKIEIVIGFSGKNAKKVSIYDSHKKLPFPLSKIAKSFNLPISKGEIDYTKDRPIGYEPTEEEWEYQKIDVAILCEALKIQFDEGHTKMTIGSDSINAFKETIGGNKNFRKYFPILSKHEDDFIRTAYKGGFTWVNPKYQGKRVGIGRVYDVNSLYPAMMYNELLPHGTPVYYKGKYVKSAVYPLFIQELTCSFELKEGKIPTIQLKKNRLFSENEYLSSSDGEIVTLRLTNKDLELFLNHYDVYNLNYIQGFSFMGIKGLFKNFIDKYMEIKKKTTGAIRELAKLILNNLYGKFATNPINTRKIPYLDKQTNKVRYAKGEEELGDPVYTAMGAFITAAARYTTISAAQQNYDTIIYCDTDSMHLSGDKIPDIEIHDNELGAWQHEANFKEGVFLRQKTYIETIITKELEGKQVIADFNDDQCNEKLKVTVSGMPDNVKQTVTYDNFKFGFVAYGKKSPRVVDGGVILVDTTFSLKN